LAGWSLCKSADDWEYRYASFFTFARLAELVAFRARLARVQPITVLSSTSLSAGAFRSIQGIARQIDPDIEPFRPGTKILDRLRGRKLDALWERVRLLAPRRIPPLHSRKAINKTGGVAYSLL